MRRAPTLLNSCARAATAAEARFRIAYQDATTRASRIIALDEQAAAVVRRVAVQHWSGGHFLVFEAAVPMGGPEGQPADARLRAVDGSEVLLTEELEGADVAVMIGTANARAEAASVVGQACAMRRIMSAGLIVSDVDEVDEAVAALRPNAMVLVILKNENDVPPMLTALRV
ncbi:MAG: 3-methyl-2-oxobutanoate hydroxymethyltransferase [Streptomycetales bacterium]